MVYGRSLLVSVAVLLAACDSTVGLAGVWTGPVPGGYSMTLTLTETGVGVVSGSGRFHNPANLTTPFSAVNVTGAHSHPAVSLHIAFPGNIQPLNITGALNSTLSKIDAVVFGSGFLGDSVHLTRNTPAISGRITAP